MRIRHGRARDPGEAHRNRARPVYCRVPDMQAIRISQMAIAIVRNGDGAADLFRIQLDALQESSRFRSTQHFFTALRTYRPGGTAGESGGGNLLVLPGADSDGRPA